MQIKNCINCRELAKINELSFPEGKIYEYYHCDNCGKFIVSRICGAVGDVNFKSSDIKAENADGFVPIFTSASFNGHYSFDYINENGNIA